MTRQVEPGEAMELGEAGSWIICAGCRVRKYLIGAGATAWEHAPNCPQQSSSIPMLLWCPACHQRHIDVGEHATRSHHTHACQHCGMVWRPAIVPTVGVQFLPGFKNQ